MEVPKFADTAEAAGLPKKLGYTAREVAKATGMSYSTVCQCAAQGHLRKPPAARHEARAADGVGDGGDDWLKGGSDA